MKMKSFAMFAISGMLVASMSYIAPAMAEDTMLAYEQSSPSSSDGVQNPNNNMSSMSNSNSSPNYNNMNNNSPDEAVPDTATGDDDY